MLRGFLLVLAAVASLQGQALGQTSDGTNLLTVCDDLEAQSLDSGYCVGVASGYMAGLERGVYAIFTQLLALGVLEEPTTEEQARELLNLGWSWLNVCRPENVDDLELARILAHFLENNPHRLHEPSNRLLYTAFTEAFPCEENF